MALLNEGDQAKIIAYVKDKKLIKTQPPICENERCEGYQERKLTWSNRKSVKDKYSWRCTICCTHKSIREGSFFYNIRISICQTLILIYYWCLQTMSQDTVAELVGCSRSTVISIYKRLRFVSTKINKQTKVTLGGQGRIVEIDESLFIRVKHHKGKKTLI